MKVKQIEMSCEYFTCFLFISVAFTNPYFLLTKMLMRTSLSSYFCFFCLPVTMKTKKDNRGKRDITVPTIKHWEMCIVGVYKYDMICKKRGIDREMISKPKKKIALLLF